MPRRMQNRFLLKPVFAFFAVVLLHVYIRMNFYSTSSTSQDFNSPYLELPTPRIFLDEIDTLYSDVKIIDSNVVSNRWRHGLHRCSNVTRPATSAIRYTDSRATWQMTHDDVTKTVMTYSAFFDDRPVLGPATWLRILVVAEDSPATHYCHVWYEELTAPYVTEAEILKVGRNYRFSNVTYRQLLYSCALPAPHPAPTHVTVSTSECGQSSILLPIMRPVRAEHEHEFGVCVAISFGDIDTAQFVEWIEFNRLLGVGEFNVYDGNITGSRDILQYYIDLGVLHVRPMPSPIPGLSSTTLDSIKVSSPASLNDCMMRNMYRYRYIVVIDFDEVIVPRRHANYNALLKHVNAQHEKSKQVKDAESDAYAGNEYAHTYTFLNAYFFRNLSADETQPWYLTTMRYRTRANVSSPYVTPKSFVDPRRCLSVFNHYCYVRFPLNSVTAKYELVDETLATSNHYRACNFTGQKCDGLLKQRVKDDATLVFKLALKRNVDEVLQRLGVKKT